MASAVDPANPASTLSLNSRRVFRAVCFTTLSPRVTWPSPTITTLESRRTHRIVVPCISKDRPLFIAPGRVVRAIGEVPCISELFRAICISPLYRHLLPTHSLGHGAHVPDLFSTRVRLPKASKHVARGHRTHFRKYALPPAVGPRRSRLRPSYIGFSDQSRYVGTSGRTTGQHLLTDLAPRPYLFSEISTEARVVSQSMRRVQPLPAWSNAMVKLSTGEGSFATFMFTRARSSPSPG